MLFSAVPLRRGKYLYGSDVVTSALVIRYVLPNLSSYREPLDYVVISYS